MTRIRTLGTGLLLVTSCWLAPGCGGASKHNASDDCKAPDNCATTCSYEGTSYYAGASFPAKDGCNTCSCDGTGVVSCTKKACISCESISADYQTLLDHAKTCDPQAPNQCTLRVFEGLGCGCGTFVNPANWDDAAIAAAVASYTAGACGGNVLCGECNVPVSAACSAQGECVTNGDPTDGVACLVGGTTYPNGSTGIADPTSCNTCVCDRGTLSCDDADCPVPCPAGMAPGRSCAQCGDVDNCEVVETGCFPTCTDTCAEGACIDGLCISACG